MRDELHLADEDYKDLKIRNDWHLVTFENEKGGGTSTPLMVTRDGVFYFEGLKKDFWKLIKDESGRVIGTEKLDADPHGEIFVFFRLRNRG